MKMFLAMASVLAVGALAAVPTAWPHVTLERQEAPADSYYKAVFRVPHGCEGSPTVRLRVQLPHGVTGVKPQPKPGWEVATVMGKLAEPYTDSHGNTITEGVREVAWSGGRLLDAHYDEFVMQGRLPDKAETKLYFPVVQECEQGVHRWIELPEPGKSADDYKEPAPQLTLTPKPLSWRPR